MLEHVKRELVPMGIGSLAALATSMAYELLWNQAETRAIFLGA